MSILTAFVVKYTQHFKAIRVIDTELFPVWLTVSGELLGNTSIDSPEFKLGISKLDFWFRQLVDNSIMFSCENNWAIDFMLEQSGNLPLITPFEPTDDVLATLFNCKCNALANDAFSVGFFEVEDEHSSISFTYADDQLPDLPTIESWFGGTKTFYDKPWWHRNDSSTFDILPAEDDDLSEKPDCFFSLDFLKDSYQGPAEIIKPSFKPTVINGKKK